MGNNDFLNLIKNYQKISLEALLSKANISYAELESKLRPICNEEDSNVRWTLSNNIYFIDNEKYFYGTIRVVEKGFGFLINSNPEIEDAFVPPFSLNNAISSDKVIYKLEKEEDGRFKGEVIEVVEREKTSIIGTIEKNGVFFDFIPSDSSFKSYRFRILNKQDVNLQEGKIFKAKIARIDKKFIFIRLQKEIGTSNNSKDRIISVAYEFGIEPEFEDKAVQEANKVAKPINYDDDEVKRRKKIIKDLNLVTIDGVDSKDLDDAIYIEKRKDGSYLLLVSIADVSYYVRQNSPLDKNALKRGNSVYLVDRVIPMLPKILSDGVCSLNPNEEKLCMVCEMEFDSNGHLISKKVYESIMISKARLNYKQVNNYYKENVIDESNETKKVLDSALELHKLIEKNKIDKGVIDFDIDEPKIIVDGDSNVIDIEVRERGISERLIENFMVAANESVGTMIFEKKLPFLYRNHDKPNSEDVIEWMSQLKLLGVNASINKNLDEVSPKDLSIVLDAIDKAIKDPQEKTVLNITLLHHMAKAKYELENIGHFGLASDCYTHFTSPIRRYSDLVVHRYLKKYLIDNETKNENKLSQNAAVIREACSIINATEKQAVDCEREVIKICSTEYMSKNIGKEYEGVVAAVLKFGLFIQIEKCVEGLVHISTLPDYEYNEKNKILINKNNVFYRIGQKVKVKVINADVKKRNIDFEIIN